MALMRSPVFHSVPEAMHLSGVEVAPGQAALWGHTFGGQPASLC